MQLHSTPTWSGSEDSQKSSSPTGHRVNIYNVCVYIKEYFHTFVCVPLATATFRVT